MADTDRPMNFYLCNGGAIVPLAQLDPDMDAEALRRLRELLPGARSSACRSGGGVHRITQQIPSLPAEAPSA